MIARPRVPSHKLVGEVDTHTALDISYTGYDSCSVQYMYSINSVSIFLYDIQFRTGQFFVYNVECRFLVR